MTPLPLSRLLIALALAWPAAAGAQAPDDARDKELQAARADLQRAAKRVAELSRDGATHGHLMLDGLALSKPRLGVLLTGDDQPGVRITGVTPESGAARAGLKAGDRLLEIAGKPVAGDTPAARLEHARTAVADLEKDKPVELAYQRDGRRQRVQVTPTAVSPRLAFAGGDAPGVFVFRGGEGLPRLEGIPLAAEDLRLGIAPGIQRELRRLGKLQDCTGEDCQLPMLAEAFRWSGLNLATVDARLGRYFGADAGVLVLSSRDGLEGLEAGDVIRRIDGKAVTTPREAMDALRGKPEDAQVAVEFLRDRQPRTARIAVPKAAPLKLSSLAPHLVLDARPGGSGQAPKVVQHRRVITIDADGNVQTYDDAGSAPADKDGNDTPAH